MKKISSILHIELLLKNGTMVEAIESCFEFAFNEMNPKYQFQWIRVILSFFIQDCVVWKGIFKRLSPKEIH
jgi:hypothetical protein